jgi:hypothetical protein
MKKFIASTTFVMTFAALSAFGESMTGFVADSTCAAKGKGGAEAHADCAAKCIKGGAAPVLVVGDKVYKVSNPDKLTAHAGHKVTVEGKVDGDSVTVDKVSME